MKITEPRATAPAAQTERRAALVTGANGTIGSEVCRHLANAGFDLAMVFGQNNKVVKQLEAEFASLGGKAVSLPTDLAAAGAGRAACKAAIERLGRVDVIVHAASLPLANSDSEALEWSRLEQHMTVTLRAAVELVTEAMPEFKARKFGRIILLGSMAMTAAPPHGWAAYLAAKHALWGFARSCAVELGRFGVTTNMVSPSLILSDLTAKLPHSVKEIEAARNPMRRLAEAADAAAMISFLAGDSAAFVNGQNLLVSGGAQ